MIDRRSKNIYPPARGATKLIHKVIYDISLCPLTPFSKKWQTEEKDIQNKIPRQFSFDTMLLVHLMTTCPYD